MSFTKFKTVPASGHSVSFYYNNQTNGLYDNNMNPLSRPWVEPANWDQLKNRYGTDRLAKNPQTIKISLGQGCNYSCGYCLQKDIGNPNERPSNGMTPLLIKNIERHLDTSETTRIELWGGETLLYWNDIKNIIEHFDREGITWGIPTNGTPLSHKHIDFFMQMKGTISMGISHDGPAHESTRGKEFLHKKVDIFHRINEDRTRKIQYSFNPVISRTNYDLFAINDFFGEFFAKHGLMQKGLTFELGRVYDSTLSENSTHHVIAGADIPLYKDILRRYLDAHIDQYRTIGETHTGKMLVSSLFHTGNGALPYARSLQQMQVPLQKSKCGVDDSRNITLDINGNVRTCQNTDDSHNSGSLMLFKGIKIKNVKFDRDDHCGTCEVRTLCKSSCPLDLGERAWYTNCAIEKTHYREIQRAALKVLFNAEIELDKD